MSIFDDALKSVGVELENTAVNILGNAIDNFSKQTLGFDGLALGKAIITAGSSGVNEAVLNDIVNIASTIPVVRNVLGNPGNGSGGSASGDFEHVHYANDLIAHQPKFKFLFKVGFYGFGGGSFHYYVSSCDKPKVRFNHADVNYYNFRTRVLTSVTYEPLSVTFLDEIGNSVNGFFTAYTAERSGTGNGNWGINKGFGDASSSKPYEKGYSKGKEIVIEQIFANGTKSNRFKFKNPRIESFDFDGMDMAANDVNYLTCTFSYDAIECETVGSSTIHSWGETDIHRGGGVAGSNGGSAGGGQMQQRSIGNTGGISGSNNSIDIPRDLNFSKTLQNFNLMNSLPESLSGLGNSIANDLLGGLTNFSNNSVSSALDTVSKNIQDTFKSISDGSNLKFGGTDIPPFEG